MSLDDLKRLTGKIHRSPKKAQAKATSPKRIEDPLGRVKSERRIFTPKTDTEMTRILALPVTKPMSKADKEAFQRRHTRAQAYDNGFRLADVQVAAIDALERSPEGRGVCGFIGVGSGKTLIALMSARHAMRELGSRKVVLCLPPQAVTQLVQIDLQQANEWIPMGYEVHVLHAKTPVQRKGIAKSNRSGLYVLPYSLLSQPSGEELLRRIGPEAVICDEAHNLANVTTSAKARRLMSFVDDHQPMGVCLSGTLTSKELRDYSHLIQWSLGSGCPIPTTGVDLRDWAKVLNADSVGADDDVTASLRPLVSWANYEFPKVRTPRTVAGFRKAFQLRLQSAPGVVVSLGDAVASSLTIRNLPVEAPDTPEYKKLMKLMSDVELGIAPTGEEITHAIHSFRWFFELSAGCYNELVHPEPQDLADRFGKTVEEAEEVLDLAKIHLEAKRSYNSELRQFLRYQSREGLDSPFLVGSDMRVNGAANVGQLLYDLWNEAKELRRALFALAAEGGFHHGSLKELSKWTKESMRDSRFVRVCDYKIEAAVQWAKSMAKKSKKTGGLIFVHNVGLGDWLLERLREELPAGRVLKASAGDENNREILDPKNAHKFAVASLSAHGESKNLQHWHHTYYLQWPRGAKLAEQSLGRTHRKGQKADEVWAYTCNSNAFDYSVYTGTMIDSLYIHQSLGTRQKVIYATYDPLPKLTPREVLVERGLLEKQTTQAQERFLHERFGA